MKQRRQFIRKLGGLALISALPFSGRASSNTSLAGMEKGKKLEGPFVHMVFFWLKDDEEKTRKKFVSELRAFIDNVDMIRRSHIGTPADTDREVIDNTYSYSLVTSFDSRAEHDLYQEHPLHQKFIDNAASLWTKVLVYDSEMI